MSSSSCSDPALGNLTLMFLCFFTMGCGNYDDQHDHKNCYNLVLALALTFVAVIPRFVCKFPRKLWYREVEGSFPSPFHRHFCEIGKIWGPM